MFSPSAIYKKLLVMLFRLILEQAWDDGCPELFVWNGVTSLKTGNNPSSQLSYTFYKDSYPANTEPAFVPFDRGATHRRARNYTSWNQLK